MLLEDLEEMSLDDLQPAVDIAVVAKKKSVRFTPDTLVRRENTVATTISKHVYDKDLGYTQYHIQVDFCIASI